MDHPKIAGSRIVHREQAVIKLEFARDESVMTSLRKIAGLRWSATHGAWYVPDRAESIRSLQELGVQLQGEKVKVPEIRIEAAQSKIMALSTDTEEKLRQLGQWMRSRRYSASTIATYTDALRSFFRFYGSKDVSGIGNEAIVRFNNEYILKNGYSSSFQKPATVPCIKLFYRTVENNQVVNAKLIHRPKRARVRCAISSRGPCCRLYTAAV
jgi:integrase/recombinase XerD